LTHIPIQFADDSSGLGAFNVNLKDFIFQMITFVIVLLVLRKWVVPKVVQTMDARQSTLEKSLKDAKATEEALAKDAGADIISKAENAAGQRANLIVQEAETRLDEERQKLRTELRSELADLVADATEKIIHEKLDEKRDMSLIERAIKGISG
jgi:F-type H+-transporting ATPase subunit b